MYLCRVAAAATSLVPNKTRTYRQGRLNKDTMNTHSNAAHGEDRQTDVHRYDRLSFASPRRAVAPLTANATDTHTHTYRHRNTHIHRHTRQHASQVLVKCQCPSLTAGTVCLSVCSRSFCSLAAALISAPTRDTCTRCYTHRHTDRQTDK